MPTVDDVILEPGGARFWRADLHVHTFGGSHDVTDRTMTPASIVATAENEKLNLVAVTDHNEITSVAAAIDAARNTGVFVVPGVELSTAQGHLLCYLPSFEALQKFYAYLTIVDRGLADSRCQQSVLDCLDILNDSGGFGVLAHVDGGAGLEQVMPGGSKHKSDILCHRSLLGIELKQAGCGIFYSPSDSNATRKQIGAERAQRLGIGPQQPLARILNSDAHSLNALGRNAQQERRVTRYKMDAPSFASLRIALQDADARVRIEDLVPPTVPMVLGVAFGGGFLSNQTIHFSSNLNCILGGRGTGKSTAFEAVRCLSNQPSDNRVVDSEVWPDDLYLFWRDEVGQDHTIYRAKGAGNENSDDPLLGPTSFEIDCFSQGEAARIGLEAQTDPLALLRYLDKFVDIADPSTRELVARETLALLEGQIDKAVLQVARIPQVEQSLVTVERQLQALRRPEVKELIDLQRELAAERAIRTEIVEKLGEIKTTLTLSGQVDAAQDLVNVADPGTVSVGGTELAAILGQVKAFTVAIKNADQQIKGKLDDLLQHAAAQIAAWKAKDATAQKRVDTKRRELEAMNVQFEMAYIAKLTKDEAQYRTDLKKHRLWVPHLQTKKQERVRILADRWAAREQVATIRDAFGRLATNRLREALDGLNVTLKYQRNGHAPEAARVIIDAMGWKTNQQPRASWLVQDLTVPLLLKAIKAGQIKPLTDLRTPEGTPAFGTDEAAMIVERLSDPAVVRQLERAEIFDLPRLLVTRLLVDGSGNTRRVTRDFAKLSFGQQQSVLLALILSSDAKKPLIIDQPEDNLDGEFIYSTLVPVLRRAKERRQVIVVTHNANVAVLGDAELIVVFKALSDRGEIVERGSIDRQATRDAACSILEGAKEAFVRRAKIYGVLSS